MSRWAALVGGVVAGFTGAFLGHIHARAAVDAPVVVERTVEARPNPLDAEDIPIVVDGEVWALCDFAFRWELTGTLTITSLDCDRTEEATDG